MKERRGTAQGRWLDGLEPEENRSLTVHPRAQAPMVASPSIVMASEPMT